MNWLKHDHHQFESAIYACLNISKQKDWVTLGRLLDDFISRYESHVRAEEDVLFPYYEARQKISQEPTELLKADHRQIFRLLRHIREQLELGKRTGLEEDLSRLYRVLTRHHDSEEKIFLPMASESLLADKDAILSALKVHAGQG